MADLYCEYKPLRNLLKEFNLTQSIEDLWIISNYVMHDGKLHSGLKIIKKSYLFPHDLLLLLKEIILNSSETGKKRLGNFADFIKLINAIRKFQDTASGKRVTQENIWHEMHRIGHQQLYLQKKITLVFLMRYIKVFGEKEVNTLLHKATGLSIKDFYFLGMAISGHLLNNSGINVESYFTELERNTGITPEQVESFLSITTSTVSELKDEIKQHAQYDEFWAYTWNPVESKPLISLDKQHPYRFYCPIPDLFLRRISQGLFYAFGNSLDANKYGKSFENYIGEIIKQIFFTKKHAVSGETEYFVGKDKKHGADWVIKENDALLFIECKTKRMTQKAKFSENLSDEYFNKDISIMVDAIVQLYKNIEDAKKHTLNDEQKNLPIFPLVITLEDWTIFSLSTKSIINESVKSELLKTGIKESVISKMPFTIVSSEEFEIVSNVIQDVGILDFFSKKTNERYVDWMIVDFCSDCFPSIKKTNLQELFVKDWDEILPKEVSQTNLL